MTLDFFYKSINFKELDIISVKLEDYTLRIEVAMKTYLELIANGYRPELDFVQKKAFIFKNIKIKSLEFNKPINIEIISYHDNVLKLSICNNMIDIENNDIEIISI